MFKGETYKMNFILTFREIGMTNDCKIIIANQVIAGGDGPESNIIVNLSEEFIRKDNVSSNNPNIPDRRTIGKGINLYGII